MGAWPNCAEHPCPGFQWAADRDRWADSEAGAEAAARHFSASCTTFALSTFGLRVACAEDLATMARSSKPHGVSSPLMRTTSSRPLYPPCFKVAGSVRAPLPSRQAPPRPQDRRSSRPRAKHGLCRVPGHSSQAYKALCGAVERWPSRSYLWRYLYPTSPDDLRSKPQHRHQWNGFAEYIAPVCLFSLSVHISAMANHASTRTTQPYNRRRDEMSLDEVEKIAI
jgi:hypothetical protein